MCILILIAGSSPSIYSVLVQFGGWARAWGGMVGANAGRANVISCQSCVCLPGTEKRRVCVLKDCTNPRH